ncbi:phage tail assembly chaperone GT [Mammaliicoccus vitulinus]|uniref:phage tail assembly chaperone GT n=1 Tax=Mammaliicoccus vitulinus TaxID=71237 RepID=UPI001869177D|nr:hypothetical protein [Mammaliicoccus vitulinus]
MPIPTWEEHKQNLKKLIRDMAKEGKDINEILKLPFNFIMDELTEEDKTKERKESMLDAFM